MKGTKMNGYLKIVVAIVVILGAVVGAVTALDSVRTEQAVQAKQIEGIEDEQLDIKQSLEQLKSNDSALMVKLNSGDSAIKEEINEMEKNIIKAIKGE